MSSILEFPPAPVMATAVAELKAAIGNVTSLVAAGHLEGMSESELLAVAEETQAIASQADAVAVSVVAEMNDGDVAKSDGFTSTTRFLESKAGLSKGQSRAQVALGEKLRWEFEATQAAWLAGEITEGTVQVITSVIPRKLKGLPEAEYAVRRAELEAMALHHARTEPVAQVQRAIERAAIVVDPAGADAAVQTARESEFLSFVPVPDGVEVRGFLSVESAAAVMTAFDQCHDRLYRTGQLTDAPVGAVDDDATARLDRTPSRRRARREHRNAQILTDLATRLLDDGALGSKHAQRPHVMVTVHADDYAAGLGGEVLLPGFGQVPVPTTTIDRILCDAEIHPVITRRPGAPLRSRSRGPGRHPDPDDGSPPEHEFPGSVPGSTDPPWRPQYRRLAGGGWEFVDPGETEPTAEQIAVDTDVAAIAAHGLDLDDAVSWWNRLLGESPRHVLDVGRSFRTATPKLRHALTIRDGGCAAPGCDADPSRCEAHHITYWEHGGDTALANLVLLCSRHHHLVHEGHWRIELNHGLDPGHPNHVTLHTPPRHT